MEGVVEPEKPEEDPAVTKDTDAVGVTRLQAGAATVASVAVSDGTAYVTAGTENVAVAGVAQECSAGGREPTGATIT